MDKENLKKGADESNSALSVLFSFSGIGFGVSLGWLWLLFQTPLVDFYLSEEAVAASSTPARIVSLVVMCVCLALIGILSRNERFAEQSIKIMLAIVVISGPIGLISLWVSAFSGGWFEVLYFLGWGVVALCAACLSCLWATALAGFKTPLRRIVCIASSALIAVILFLLISFLEIFVALFVVMVLPLCSGLLFRMNKDHFHGLITARSVHPKGMPYVKLIIALGIFGFAFGTLWGTGLSKDAIFSNRLAFTIVGVFAICILLYSRLNKSHSISWVYRLVPVVLIAAFLLLPFPGQSRDVWSGVLGGSGYLIYETLMLMVIFDAIARFQLRTLPAYALARFATVSGLCLGWVFSLFFNVFNLDMVGITAFSAVAVFVLVLANALLIDEKALYIADVFYGNKRRNSSGDGLGKLSEHDNLEKRCQEISLKYRLTNREEEVLALLARGRNARYIQETLVVTNATAKAHRYNIYKKMDIHSHQELIDFIESWNGG